MKRLIIFYGLIAGSVLTTYVTMLDYTRIIYTTSWGPYVGYLAILILPLCIYLALNEWSKQQQRLLYKHVLALSLTVALLAGSIYSAYTFVDIQFFDASHLKNLFDFTADEMKMRGKSTVEVNERLTHMRAHYLSYQPYINTYLWYISMALLYSVIFFFVFRLKQKKQLI